MGDVATEVSDNGFTPEETAYFESGGESAIPGAGGADDGEGGADAGSGDGGGDGAQSDAGKAPVAAKKPGAEGEPVPLATFLSEKNARKALAKTNTDLQNQVAELRGRFSIIEKLNPALASETGEKKPATPPKAEEDIFGAFESAEQRIARLEKASEDAATAAKETSERNAFVNDYQTDAKQFEATTPDYRPAYNFLLASRAAELISIGYDDPKAVEAAGGTPQEVHAAAKALHDAIVADEYGIAQLAKSKGKSAAATIYGLAKQRGYVPAAAGGDKTDAGSERLDAIERGQQAHKSLNGTGGSTGDDGMTAERLLSMPIGDFEKWCEKNPAKAQRIMGG